MVLPHISGECLCRTGYSGDDCSISATAAPLVEDLTNLGLCDLVSTNCELFSVYGDKFVDSTDLQCHYEEAHVSGSCCLSSSLYHLHGDQLTKWCQHRNESFVAP